MRSRILKTIGVFLLAAAVSAPAWAAKSAVPGTVNYVEGKVAIGNQALDSKSVGSVELEQGQLLTTGKGRAEILLTPGVFFRLDGNSVAKMISPTLTRTEIELQKGRASVEVADIHKENNLRVDENGATAQLLKPGLYDFDADRNHVRVFDGQALVLSGDRQIKVKGGHELNLSGEKAKAGKFDKKTYEADDFYRWSSLRSSYLAGANVQVARTYLVPGGYGPGWFGAGWYWDPWWGAYTFIPGDGIFYSPFGWGFYSPAFVYWAPVVYYVPNDHDADDAPTKGGTHSAPAPKPGTPAGGHSTPLPGGNRPAANIGHAYHYTPPLSAGGFHAAPRVMPPVAMPAPPPPPPARPH